MQAVAGGGPGAVAGGKEKRNVVGEDEGGAPSVSAPASSPPPHEGVGDVEAVVAVGAAEDEAVLVPVVSVPVPAMLLSGVVCATSPASNAEWPYSD